MPIHAATVSARNAGASTMGELRRVRLAVSGDDEQVAGEQAVPRVLRDDPYRQAELRVCAA
jgi:hypothetical protein